MTVAVQTPFASFLASGSATFAYAFKVNAFADLIVKINGVTQASSLYTATGIGSSAGSIVFISAPTAGAIITVQRKAQLQRSTDYQINGDLLAGTLNPDFDAVWMAMQDAQYQQTLALQISAADIVGVNMTLPTPVGGTVIGWDAIGKNLVNFVLQAGTSLVNLSASTGSSLVGFIQSGTGAVARTVQGKLRESVSVFDFGAKGDGVTDDTAAIQAAVNSLPAGGVVHGQGQSFSVSSVLLQSNMTMLNMTLVELPGTTALRSPITIDGTSSAKTNIRLCDITIDGNRSNQTNITTPSAEDGGLHGIRCIGNLSNLYLERVTAKNCGSYGMLLLSSTSVGATDSTFVFNNIVIRDSFFTGNRAHGIAADSTYGLRMSNVKLTGNGNDLNGVDPLTYGTRGATSGGLQYGSGFDMEGYGLGSSHNDMRLVGVTATGNARMGGLFFDQLATRPAGFSARQKIWISNSHFDAGISGASDGSALQFTSTIGSKALAPLYDSVYISNTRLDGTLTARCVNILQITGGAIASNLSAYYCLLDYATNIVLGSTPTGTATLINASNSTYSLGVEPLPFPAAPVLTNVGPAGTLANIVYTQVENIRDRTFRFLVTADWTISAAGNAIFRITPGANSVLVCPPKVDVISFATALPILASYSLATNYTKFSDPGTGLLNLQFVVDVKV